MYRSLMVVVLALLVSAAELTSSTQAFADPKPPRDSKATRHRTTAPTHKPIARSHLDMSCAQFGAGFTRLPGSDNCVRFNGGVGMGVGAVP